VKLQDEPVGLQILQARRLHRWHLHRLGWIRLQATVRIAQYRIFHGSPKCRPTIGIAASVVLISPHGGKSGFISSPDSATCIVEVGTDVVGETVLGTSHTTSVFDILYSPSCRIKLLLYVSNRSARASSTASGRCQLGASESWEERLCTVRYNCSCSVSS